MRSFINVVMIILCLGSGFCLLFFLQEDYTKIINGEIEITNINYAITIILLLIAIFLLLYSWLNAEAGFNNCYLFNTLLLLVLSGTLLYPKILGFH
jgi:NADH:ubiquinone oxidoreductase subunit 2 (subunit N)